MEDIRCKCGRWLEITPGDAIAGEYFFATCEGCGACAKIKMTMTWLEEPKKCNHIKYIAAKRNGEIDLVRPEQRAEFCTLPPDGYLAVKDCKVCPCCGEEL